MPMFDNKPWRRLLSAVMSQKDPKQPLLFALGALKLARLRIRERRKTFLRLALETLRLCLNVGVALNRLLNRLLKLQTQNVVRLLTT
ncbi:MAG: hypothetical protein AMJ72_02745 [Acidithiobacillales bacterium SM1_46]|nr:MAG: hypothetical protein AMJ72_02745 [Acidithiobacillales bacterium SM1_46]